MKIAGIGDLFIPASAIERGFAPLRALGHTVETMDWGLASFEELQAINLQVEQYGCESVAPPPAAFELCRDADVVVTQFCPIPRALIDACPSIKAVGVLRGGTENVCSEYLAQKSIALFHTPGRNAEAVADFAVGLMICEARNIARGHFGLKNGRWLRTYPNSGHIPDLGGRTAGLIGCGAIGQKVAKRLRGFDMRILAFDPYANPDACAPLGIQFVPLDALLRESDFVSLHARLTEENRHMIDAAQLALMKPEAYLINTSRAGLVNEEALYQALVAGSIAGAALDVFEHEPPGVHDKLVQLPNVTLTPHMAGGSNDAFYNTPALLLQRMEHWLSQQG